MKRSQLTQLVREVLSESEEKALGLALKREIEKELADDGKLDEALDPLSLLGWFLAGNTATNMISKYISKKLRQYGWDKAANKAQWLADKTHKIESNMVKSIEGWLSFVVKVPEQREKMAKAIFVVVLGVLAGKAGMGAVDAMEKSQHFSSVAGTIKTALKGKDIRHTLKLI